MKQLPSTIKELDSYKEKLPSVCLILLDNVIHGKAYIDIAKGNSDKEFTVAWGPLTGIEVSAGSDNTQLLNDVVKLYTLTNVAICHMYCTMNSLKLPPNKEGTVPDPIVMEWLYTLHPNLKQL